MLRIPLDSVEIESRIPITPALTERTFMHTMQEVDMATQVIIKQLFWNQQEEWSGRGDLNARPPAPKGAA
jgi:hypothetical protein